MEIDSKQSNESHGLIRIVIDNNQRVLNVEIPNKRPIEIFNEQGRLVFYLGSTGLIHKISLAGFSRGHYLLKAGRHSATFDFYPS